MRIARTVPELAVAAIHRWRTWPNRLRLTGLDGRDIDVALVVELTDGTLTAVQCKCYAETYTVGKKDIDSFLSASEAECFGHRWIVSTASPGSNAATAAEAARPNVSWIDFRFYLNRPVEKPPRYDPFGRCCRCNKRPSTSVGHCSGQASHAAEPLLQGRGSALAG